MTKPKEKEAPEKAPKEKKLSTEDRVARLEALVGSALAVDINEHDPSGAVSARNAAIAATAAKIMDLADEQARQEAAEKAAGQMTELSVDERVARIEAALGVGSP